MARRESSWSMKGRWSPLRLGLAYLVVPPSAPFVLIGILARGERLRLADRAGIVLLYSAVSLAAMIVLGTPLLILFAWRRWSGFVQFGLGAGLCAGAAYLFISRPLVQADNLVFFTFWGVVEGLLLRLILFGSRRLP